MSTRAMKESVSYVAAFQSLQQRAEARGSAAWINRLRENAFDRFEQTGFPTTRDEEWKYTNIAQIAKTKFAQTVSGNEESARANSTAIEQYACPEARDSQMVFVNGVFQTALSSLGDLPQGIVAMSLAEALENETHQIVLRERLARQADYNANPFTALNTAFIENGAYLRIPKDAQVGAPIHLLFLSDIKGDDALQASFPRVVIVAEKGSAATVIESYASAQDGVYLTNAVVEIFVEDNARLEHYKVQRESAQSFHIAATNAELGRDSRFNSTTITLGAELSRHDILVKLDAEGSECAVDGLYLVTTGQHTDTHSIIDHRVPHCTSHQLYKGILDGKSRAVFNGKIFVRVDAQQTNAFQTNRNLLLSPEARVDTKPQLEIYADDVKCSHGATVGQLEEEELFYLLSRGLHSDLARNLLTYGFAEEVINKIKIESIKAQLDETVLHRLHARLGTPEEALA
ncbi:MAG: Fe-S cluster assembly protein SufD [Pyrinomonadaceae bacterium]